MGASRYVGRVGVLAVALGVGMGVSAGVALADPDSSTESNESGALKSEQSPPTTGQHVGANNPPRTARATGGPRRGAGLTREAGADLTESPRGSGVAAGRGVRAVDDSLGVASVPAQARQVLDGTAPAVVAESESSPAAAGLGAQRSGQPRSAQPTGAVARTAVAGFESVGVPSAAATPSTVPAAAATAGGVSGAAAAPAGSWSASALAPLVRVVVGFLLSLGGMNATNPNPTNPIQQLLYSLAKGLSTTFNPAPPPGTPTVGTPNTTTGIVTGSLGFATGAGLTFTATDPAMGAVSVAGDGTYIYTPSEAARQAAEAATTDSFVATVHNGLSTNSVTVTVQVDPGTPVAGTPTVGSPAPESGAVTGVAAFTDTAGRALSYTTTPASVGGGAVSINAFTGAFTYTPTEAQRLVATGATTDSFTVTASNGVRTATQSVTVSVDPLSVNPPDNQPPQVGDPAYSVTGINTWSGIVRGIVHVSDEDSDTLTYSLSAPLDPDVGVVAVDSETGAWAFRPSPQSRLDAWLAEGGLTTEFSIVVSDGQASTPIVVTAPIDGMADFSAEAVDTGAPVGGIVVAVSADGHIYYDNPNGSEGLAVLNPDGSEGEPISLGFHPWDAVVGPDGRIYATDHDVIGVVVVDPDAPQSPSVFADIAGAAGLAFGPDGQLYVTNLDERTLITVNAAGEITSTVDLGDGAYPTDVAVGPDGRIYVADFTDDYGSARLTVRNSDGSIAEVLYDEPSAPLGDYVVTPGVAVDTQGVVYLTDGNHDVVTIFRLDGTTSTVSADVTRGIALGPDRQVYLAGFDTSSITVLTPIPIQDQPFYFGVDDESGVVVGGLNVLDPGGYLTYELTAPVDSAMGVVVVDSTTGEWTFTPSPQAEFQAWTSQLDTETEFSVTVSDGNVITISVPIREAVKLSTDVLEVGGSPSGLAFGADGRLYIADEYQNSVTVLAPDLSVERVITLGAAPSAIAVAADGLILVGSNADNFFTIINPADDFALFEFALESQPAGVNGLAFDSEGRLYVASQDTNTVTIYNEDGTFAQAIDVLMPTGITVAPDGRILVTGLGTYTGYLNIYEPDTTLISSWITGGHPAGIAVTPDGHLAITDLDGPARDFTLFTSDGARGKDFTLGVASWGVAVDGDGHIYLANPYDGTITIVTVVPDESA